MDLPPGFRLTHEQRRNIQTDQELMGQLTSADIIMIEYASGKRESLWKRPIEEVMARGGPPYDVAVVKFLVTSEMEVEEYRQIVERLKHGD